MPSQLAARLEAFGEHELSLGAAMRPRGWVAEVGDGVAQVIGLDEVGSEELVRFDSGAYGMAYDLAPGRTGVILLIDAGRVGQGQGAAALGKLPSLAVGPELLGRVIDPLGRPIDGRGRAGGREAEVLAAAPKLIERAPVCRSLHTGVMAIDAAIPIGRGQRQLVIGDRNVGKTALALDIVAAQTATDVLCVYVVIGQPFSRVLAIRDALASRGALAHTIVVAAEAAEPPGLQYLAPYAGMAVAEQFRAQASALGYARGHDTLVVFDDLTKHADAYRELALLMGRPPGREAFPGDIFYIHAELLERATAFSDSAGGGSITALPIIETTDSEISAYIPTNLISITDGQLYLDSARFERNERPAIDVGRSVSRIGGAAQTPLIRKIAHNLRIDLSRAESLETLTRVGLDVDPKTRAAIDKGKLLRALLRQPRYCLRSIADQALVLTAVNRGWLDKLAPAEAAQRAWRVVERARRELPELVAALERGELLADDWAAKVRAMFEQPAEP